MIRIDDSDYDIPIVAVDMKAEYLYKYAERTADGKLHSELIGVYFNYSIQFGNTADTAEYAALWEKITEPTEFHTVRVWDESGTYSFSGYFSRVGHKLRKATDAGTFWKELTINFIARNPARS